MLVLALMLGACESGPECLWFPGPDVEPGLYTRASFWIRPDTADIAGFPYADAEEMTIEITADRSSAIVRYVRNGAEIEERWSIDIYP